MSDLALLVKIDAALTRLRAINDPYSSILSVSVANLEAKRQRVLDGTYMPDEDADRLITLFHVIGAGICESVQMREPWYTR